MNIPTEENNLPLFKHSPEIASQLLIQTSDSKEFIQVPNICDDLLLTELDGAVWTLGGLPILLNGQNDSQPLLINQSNETVDDLQHPEETLQHILEQSSVENQFVENNVDTDDNTEIVYPLEISHKKFLTDNGLFITNQVINDEVDVSPNCDIVQNNESLKRTNYKEESEESSESVIQSSDVSSQEAFIDINGMLISEQSVLNLNCPDLLFNIQEPQNSCNIIHNSEKIKRKRTINTTFTNSVSKNSKPDCVSDVIGSINNTENEVESNQNPVLNDSVNTLIKVLNVDGSSTILNIDGSLFNDKSIANETSNLVAYDNSATYEFETSNVSVDDEPDSTVTNDSEDSLDISDLATIITAYQCKRCDFKCNDRDQFLIHFKGAHLQKPVAVNQIFEVQPEFLVSKINEQVQNVFEWSDLNRKTKKIKLPDNENVQTISILCTNGEIPVLNSEVIKTEANIEDTYFEKAKDLQINIPKNSKEFHQQYLFKEPHKIQSTNYVFNNELEKILQDDDAEKKIMRLKKRKKSKMINLLQIPQNGTSYVFKIDTDKNEESNIISTPIAKEIPVNENSVVESEFGKHLIYLCSQCAEQFLTVEDCRKHMIKDHKLCAIENTESPHLNFKETEIKKENPESIISTEQKNKKLIEKILGQGTLKSRKHKCPIKGCSYRFARPELLARHESCHVEGNRSQFRCPECEEIQTCWRTCSIHLWRCHQVDVDLYSCPICTYKGSTSVKLKDHIKIHSEERDYVCPECCRGFKQPSQLRNHRIIHLENQPKWSTQKKCEKCGKIFADSKCLKKHIQAVHSKLKPFICNVCGHSCARKAMLQTHLRQHTGEKPYSCSLCLYKTGDHNSLRRHKMRHSGDRPYKCPHCDYTAIQSNSYKTHLANKHPGMPGVYNCTECTFRTVSEEAYICHMNDHRNNLIDMIKYEKKSSAANMLSNINQPNSELSGSNDNDFFVGTAKSGQNIISKKNIELEDDETQNCFLSLSDLTDEQTIDTGGITIPADPDEPDSLNM